jgi:predicted Zn-dependent protease
VDAAPGHLEHDPSHRDLLYMLAVAQRMLKRIPEALATLDVLEAWHPGYPRLYQERGHCHIFQREAPEAIAAFERATRLNPALPASWNALQTLYRMTGRETDAELAAQHVQKLGELPVEIVTARSLLADGNVNEAEDIIRPFLKRHREHIEGMRLLAKIALENEYPNDAEILLESVLELAPGYHAARYDYVLALVDLQKHGRAREEIEKLIAAEPTNPANRITFASILVALGELEEAVACYRKLIEERPQDADVTHSLGHALKTLGQHEDAVAAYHRATGIRPGYGEPYWSLANLKTYRFTDEELDRMREYEAVEFTQSTDR